MRASLRVVVTLLVVAAAVLAGIWLWRYYMLSPWTRDARVRADVVVVAPDVSGWVTDLEVKDNQVVKVGDVLMRIDQERYQANLEQARAVAETRHQQYLLRQNEAARRSRLGIGAISAEDKENAQINAAIARSEYQEALAQVKIAELKLLANVEPTFNWVRLAQRIPVRIRLDQVPADVHLSAGMTASVTVQGD